MDAKHSNVTPSGDEQVQEPAARLYIVVLTGGPCGGKTTGQARLCTFFENLGWRVFRVPETASVLLSGGVKYADLGEDAACQFQENLLRSMLAIEKTFFDLGRNSAKNCLIICDRGTMDVSCYISENQWDKILNSLNLNAVELRDNRYNQIVHMVSAANGAPEFYTTEEHSCRSEDVAKALEIDKLNANAWLGHPYFDIIDNSTDFETKIRRLISVICNKVGVDVGDRLSHNTKKRKWLVAKLPPDSVFPPFRDFDVVHNYLQTNSPDCQARVRKRGTNNNFTFTYSIRKPRVHGQVVEVKTQITLRDYNTLKPQFDQKHYPITKLRRCFLYNHQYFQLDVYKKPCHERCEKMVLLETYSSLENKELLQKLPPFLEILEEVTGNPDFSMYNLSLKEDWDRNDAVKPQNYCTAFKGVEIMFKNNSKVDELSGNAQENDEGADENDENSGGVTKIRCNGVNDLCRDGDAVES